MAEIKFENTKKINLTGCWFQVSNSKHVQYGESIAVGLIGKKQKEINGKMTPVPDYDKKIINFLTFNQASKLAAYLRAAAMHTILNKDFREFRIKTGCQETAKAISINYNAFNHTINYTMSNGKQMSVSMNFEETNLAADLINARMNLMNQDKVDTEGKDISRLEQDYAKLYKEISRRGIENRRITSPLAIQKLVDIEMKADNSLSKIEALKIVGEKF